MKAFLIRHGETQHNNDGTITGQIDISLNDRGLEQAELLAERLSDIDFMEAYSSDLERTFRTTEIVAEKHGLRPKKSKELREMGFGVFEDRHKSEFRQAISDFDGDSHFFTPEGGESSNDAAERFLEKMNEIKDNHSGDNVLIGGHGVVLKSVLMNIFGLTGRDYNRITLGNASVSVLEWDSELGWKLVTWNDTAHMK